ncbi:MAG: hypothetical protein HZA16_09705 [Nitrospirae bacterium]|nr:hypothetical protein [Nitrospirota bacterium]
MYAEIISSGMSIHLSALTSCLMISIGKMGDRSSGPTGFPVAGLRGGGSCSGRSGVTLYQQSGISFSERRILVSMVAASFQYFLNIHQERSRVKGKKNESSSS